MKSLFFKLACITILISSCEINSDVPGPQGPEGPAGLDGLIGTVFEVEVDFTSTNDYKALASFPEQIEVFASDIVMAYILKDVDDGIDIWEPLPQTIFFNGNTLLYGFDHTLQYINFFIDGNMNLDLLPSSHTDGYVFRVAIIPAANAKSVDMSDVTTVMKSLKLLDTEGVSLR